MNDDDIKNSLRPSSRLDNEMLSCSENPMYFSIIMKIPLSGHDHLMDK